MKLTILLLAVSFGACPGLHLVVDVPVTLRERVRSSKHFGSNFDVITNVFWGTDAEGPVVQARNVSSLESLYGFAP